ncbi:MAG: hypothetical protein M0P61_12630 [Ignavibacteriaceae bacterium]|jgi:hypothetical protein|nr:hypothetical protein [Ignavibacteriaceae bacterium]
MNTSYQAIISDGKIHWIDFPADTLLSKKELKVKVEIVEDSTKRKKLMIKALEDLAAIGGISSIVDPIAWQKDQRKDREIIR